MDPQPPPADPTPSAEPPLAAPVAYPPPAYAPQRRTPGWVRFLFALVVFGFLGSMLLNLMLLAFSGLSGFDAPNTVRERHFSHARGGPDKVAILSVTGTIIDGEGIVRKQIDRAMKDQAVKAVVLRIDSPGGTITGSDYIYHYLRDLTEKRDIPLVVSMGGLAASGGYYVSMAVGDEPDTIFAEPTTWTGSIGVIIPRFDVSGFLNSHGIEEDAIASHRLKGMGSFAKPLTDEEREILQGLVDESFEQFKEIVKSGRPKFQQDPEALDELATGQIYTAEQALELGLVDKIGFIEKAVDRAIELADLDAERVSVVKYEPQPTLTDVLLGAQARRPSFDLKALLDLSAPRAYYLCSRIPPLLGTYK